MHLFVRSAASQEDRSTELDQEEMKLAAEAERGGKTQSRRGRQQSRKKSPTGKSRISRYTSGHTVSPTPDVVNAASDADAR